MKTTKSAGGIVINKKGHVLVTCQNGDSWSLPKGTIEKGETPIQAAQREITEETGVTQLELIKVLGGYSRFQIAKGGKGENTEHKKHLTFFLFWTDQTKLQPTDAAHPEAKWLAPSKVAPLLTHPADKAFYIEQYEALATAGYFKKARHIGRYIWLTGILIIFALLFSVYKSGQDTQSSGTPLKGVKIQLSSDPIVVATGDIACDPKSPNYKSGLGDEKNCQMASTAKLAKKQTPDTVMVLGDNQYEKGEIGNYNSSYEPTWGALKNITKPVPGNHEYYTPGASGYYQYFGAVAKKEQNGYYSYDIGSWHVVALNSNCAEIGGCDVNSAQYKWLANDLEKNSAMCTLAYWHHPRFSSGEHGNDPITQDFWNLLYSKKADLILNGHDHIYERFAPQNPAGQTDPAGITQFIVGTGGKNLTTIKQIQPNSVVREVNEFGVLKLNLHDSSYNWRYLSIDGKQIDVGADTCH